MKKIVFSLALVAGLFSAQAQQVEQKVSKEELAKRNWFHKNYAKDSIYGVADDAAYAYAKSKGWKSTPVLVAVIDSGIEPDHDDLKDHIWTNPREIPNNGIDDDKNGYVDDIHGWNFIGGKDGKNVAHDNTEITRLVREGNKMFASDDNTANEAHIKAYPEKYKEYQKLLAEFNKELAKNKAVYESVKLNISQQEQGLKDFANDYGKDKKITIEDLKVYEPKNQAGIYFKNAILATEGTPQAENFVGLTPNEMLNEFQEQAKEALEYYGGQVNYYLNLNFDPRGIVGDNYADITEKYYGNNTTEGPDALHGTHVAGIIGAVRNNGIGMNGVADNVRIMSVRTVPDGDERDKDVANAIRYAVDNGAKIINMSFGKAYSPNKQAVWDALKYASDHGVLLVKAAGNDNSDIDVKPQYPTNFKDGKPIANTMITVGASTRYNNKLKASFSNYGKQRVDIFAPGLEIYSTVPNNTYKYLQGTSMASPVVAGVAALVWSYFPSLTAQELRNILIKTGNYNEQLAKISTNGVVVDALKALKEAEKVSKSKR